ncbi:uncharacterized protein LOC117528877 [Thalassophryne amazonica]|uniref:uncharacterized protein LOC117528877 n=1 Tax=Thalassophryne amazonica TaxID=390379 RepID=UPI0014716839|nr:uncharacterized protein LOC117528877 [Thalassophryne amazonica]
MERRQEDKRARTEGGAVTSSGQQEPDLWARTESSWWCCCNACQPMKSVRECFCCHEWDILEPLLEELERSRKEAAEPPEPVCVTSHPDFSARLNPGVLGRFCSFPRINWKRRLLQEVSMTNDQYRLVAYRITLDWFLKGKRLGRGKRRVLPSCVVLAIRAKYPATPATYCGFKDRVKAHCLLQP